MTLLLNPFWLITTDILLGIIVAAFFLAVIVLIIRDIVLHAKYRHSKRIADKLRSVVSSLGITLADGGEPVDRSGRPDAKSTDKEKEQPQEGK